MFEAPPVQSVFVPTGDAAGSEEASTADWLADLQANVESLSISLVKDLVDSDSDESSEEKNNTTADSEGGPSSAGVVGAASGDGSTTLTAPMPEAAPEPESGADALWGWLPALGGGPTIPAEANDVTVVADASGDFIIVAEATSPQPAPPVPPQCRPIAPPVPAGFALERALLGALPSLLSRLGGAGAAHALPALDPVALYTVWMRQRAAATARRAWTVELAAAGQAQRPSQHELRDARSAMIAAAAAYGPALPALASLPAMGRAVATHAMTRVLSELSATAAAPVALLASLSGTTVGSATAAAVAATATRESQSTAALARLAGVAASDILLASHAPSTTAFCPAAFVWVDAPRRWVVLAIRGSTEVTDVLTDAAASPVPFLGGHAHAGMVAAAWQLARTHVPTCATALAARPGFSLVLTGHSLGGGVAALLTALLRSRDADVAAAAAAAPAQAAAATCFAFAPPCCASLSLSLSLSGGVTSIVAGKDVVPRLSLGSTRRLLAQLAQATPFGALHRTVTTALGRGGDPHAGVDDACVDVDGTCGAEEATAAAGTELRDLNASDFFCPPGRVIHLRHLTGRVTAETRHAGAFSEIALSPRMLSDHRPVVYLDALERLQAGASGSE